MPSTYPTGLDTLNTTHTPRPSPPAYHATLHNDTSDAVNKIEAELGVNPSGSYATVADRLAASASAVVSVKDYGATGDGTTDDRASIQAAIDAANTAGGGIVNFPKGTYKVATALILKSNVTLQGVGAASVITSTGLTATGGLTMTTPGTATDKTAYTNITLRQLKVTFTNGHGMLLRNTTNLVVENVEVTGTSGTTHESLWVQYCDRVTVNRAYVHDVPGNGIQVNGCDHVNITNAVVYNTHDDGIDIDLDFLAGTPAVKCRWVSVTNYVIDTVTNGNGIRVEGADYTAIGSGVIRNANASGIRVNSALAGATNFSTDYTTISGPTISDCATQGIFVGRDSGSSDCAGANIDGATIVNCGNSGAGVCGGIVLATGAVDALVTGARIKSCGNAGGGDTGGLVVYKQSNITVRDCYVTDCTNIAVNLWNGDALQAYTGVFIDGITFRTNTANFGGGGENQVGVVVRASHTGSIDVASAGTITLKPETAFFNVTGTTTITSVAASWVGRVVTLKFAGILTFTDGSNLKLVSNFVTSADDTITLVCDGTNWYETARAVN